MSERSGVRGCSEWGALLQSANATASCPPLKTSPLATASISSMKTIAGASRRAEAKSSRTRMAPMPTYSSTNSEAEMEKKGASASPGGVAVGGGFWLLEWAIEL